MAKRIYWQTVLKRAAAIGIPTGVAGFALLFMYLSSLGVIDVTGYSGDIICAGVAEDPCYAYINFTANEDIFIYPMDYDPWGRDTPFETDKGLKSWKMYRSWGTGWREIKLNDTCKYTWCGAPPNSPNNKYSFAFREGRDYQIRIVAYKNNPLEDIKWGFGPIDPVWYGIGEEEIGYNILNDTVVIWNTQNAYYFNKSSGIQFTNYYEDYWSRNIFCLGYYSSEEWIKIKCADELNNFNRNIQTDNLTYVNATLWKDISYGNYDMRFGVGYHLGLDDENLSITIYGKNIGIDIPFDLGFAWKVMDLDVPSTETTDKILINNTNYDLDGTYDLTFKDMMKEIESCSTNETDNETICSIVEVPISFYKVYDMETGLFGKENFLKIDWDGNLDYAVKIYGDGNQENFYTTLLINAGKFNSGDEKSTTFYWIDALTDDLTSYYKLDDNLANTTIIDSLSNHVGTLNANSNTLSTADGKIERAIDFTSNNNYIVLADAPFYSGDIISMGGWIKLHSNNSFDRVLSKDANTGGSRDWTIAIPGNSGGVQFSLWNSGDAVKTVLSNSEIKTDTWYFIVAVYNSTHLLIYVDGSLENIEAQTGDIKSSAAALEFGRRQDGAEYLDGIIDEWFLYDIDLSQAQITELYNSDDGLSYPFEDIINPTYSNNQTNTTEAGTAIKFSILYDDDLALETAGQYIFSTNNTGTWSNESAVNFTATPNWANVTKILNSTPDMLVGYRWYADDNVGNINNTGIYTLTIVDTIGPIPNITYPANTTYSTNISKLNYTYIDLYPDSCWYSKNGGATNSSAVAMGTNFTDIVSVGGNNTWTVFCNDTLNNIGSSSITFSLNVLWHNSGYPFANRSFRVDEFIEVSGTNFTLGGENYRFLGADSYYLADYATNHTYDDDGNEINNSRQYVLEILNEALYLNINVLRTWANMQGSDDSHWPINESGGHYNLFEVGEPGNYSEEMFVALDWVIYEASKRDIRLQLVLVNNWDDYGGMRWYAQKSPTTDKTHENVNDSGDPNYWVFHDQFYDDENCRQYFRNYINHTLNRNNTYSNIFYKDDPTIFAWLLGNEPRAGSDGEGRDLIKNWTTNMTAYIKSIDTNHLVGLGIEGWGYVETWGEGTDMIADHNNTGVDFATFSLHPDQWQYFAERSEHDGGGWVTEDTGTNDFVDWWTNDTNVSYNNRYEGSQVPAYIPALARYAYDNWVVQNVKWINELGMPVLLQEAGYLTNHSKAIKERFYEQMIHNFYNEGGDGLLFWTLNHDEYYYSTDIDGIMDDGYGFYLSDDLFLKNKSESIIDAINFTKHDDDGGSWIRELNPYKYDFILNIGFASDTEMDNCTLYLNVSNGTWSGYYADQANSTPLTYDDDYTFTKQFDTDDEEVYWYIQCFGDSEYINSTEAYAQIKSDTPIVSLVSPDNNTFQDTAVEFIYNVTNSIGISFCELYVDGILNKTDYTVTRDINQTFDIGDLPDAFYNWSVTCTDIDSNEGSSITNTFIITTFNIFFNGISGNNTAELGGELNLIANSTVNITICVDIDHPDFGVNYSSGAGNVNVNFSIDYFRKTTFNDSASSKVYNFTGQICNFSIDTHQYDEIDALDVNISGVGNPTDIIFYKANTSFLLSNADRFLHGILDGANIYLNKFFNDNTTANLTYASPGGILVYFYLDDTATLIDFLMNVTGVEYGFTFNDSLDDFDYIDKDLTTAHLDKSGAIMPANSSLQEFSFDDFEDGSIASRWIKTADFSYTDQCTLQRTTSETGGYIQQKNYLLDSSSNCQGSSLMELLPNNTYFSLFYIENITFRVTSAYDSSADNEHCEGNTYVDVGGTTAWTSMYLGDYEGGQEESSDADVTFLLTKENKTHWKVELSGIETSTRYVSGCGNELRSNYWTNGTYHHYKPFCDDGSGSLDNDFYVSVDYNEKLAVDIWNEITFSANCEANQIITKTYYMNNSLWSRANATIVSESVFDSLSDIATATFISYGYGDPDVDAYFYLSADEGVTWEAVTAGVGHTFVQTGNHIKWRIDFNLTNPGYTNLTSRITAAEVITPPSNVSNITFDFGGDGSIDYTIEGELNSTNSPFQVDLSDVALTNVFTSARRVYGNTYKIPLAISTDSAGQINLDTINLTYNPNPIVLDTDYIQDYIGILTTDLLISFNSTGGNITIDDIKYDYAGGNQTFQFLVHDANYLLNKTANIIYYYSRWDYELMPLYVDYLEFIPSSPTSRNVTPFGQTLLTPMFNITNYGHGGIVTNLSIYLNETEDCVNLTMSLTENKTDGIIINSTWQDIKTNFNYLDTINISMWADYECTYTTWSLFQPYLYFRQCCEGCLCSEDLT